MGSLFFTSDGRESGLHRLIPAIGIVLFFPGLQIWGLAILGVVLISSGHGSESEKGLGVDETVDVENETAVGEDEVKEREKENQVEGHLAEISITNMVGDSNSNRKPEEPTVKASGSHARASKTVKTTRRQDAQVGVFVWEERERAAVECKAKVEKIARECRETNKKFRDIEFDLEKDKERTFFGLVNQSQRLEWDWSTPPQVKRVTEIFEKPKFFAEEGPGSNDIYQGSLGDCWFLSALSTVATNQELIYRCCVARDEEVGVYGFIFQRDGHWVSIIIDDLLFWSLPRFEELTKEEQELYHDDKEIYRSVTKSIGKGLRCAESGATGETWVPLIEKAYAKLHGDFKSLESGWMSEGLEDITGGVSTTLRLRDILSPDEFWTSELLLAGTTSRLMGVGLWIETDDPFTTTVSGLISGHSYAILRAKGCRGRKFVVLRNPWGKGEWTGRWSDGSKEWTQIGEREERREVLQELGHRLGDDGEFVMEYEDFLECWDMIQITTLFDASWALSSRWLHLSPRPLIHPWTYGDVVFTFTLPARSRTTIVLSQLDVRYFKSTEGCSMWNLEFVVYKRGESLERGVVASSYAGLPFGDRSVNCEVELEEGEYIVYPRLDKLDTKDTGYFDKESVNWDARKLGRVLTERTKSRSLASNYDLEAKQRYNPKILGDVISAELSELDDKIADEDEDDDIIESTTTTTTTTQVVVEETVISSNRSISACTQSKAASAEGTVPALKPTLLPSLPEPAPSALSLSASKEALDAPEDGLLDFIPEAATGSMARGTLGIAELKGVTGDDEDGRSVWVGLRVYTRVKQGRVEDLSSSNGRRKERGVVVGGSVKDPLEKDVIVNI